MNHDTLSFLQIVAACPSNSVWGFDTLIRIVLPIPVIISPLFINSFWFIFLWKGGCIYEGLSFLQLRFGWSCYACPITTHHYECLYPILFPKRYCSFLSKFFGKTCSFYLFAFYRITSITSDFFYSRMQWLNDCSTNSRD